MKSFLLIAAIVALAASTFSCSERADSTAPIIKKKFPNVLLITMDTLRADRLGSYGYKRGLTPNLDNLAAQGVLFENAFCVFPITLPSHLSIFMGTWPRVHGIKTNDKTLTNTNLQSFPLLLKKAGYTTSAFVSVRHLQWISSQAGGFDSVDCPEKTRSAEDTLARATRWLSESSSKPLFLWVHLFDPHSPYSPHEEFMQKLRPDYRGSFKGRHRFFPKGSYTKDQLENMIDLYDNEVAYMDHHLGKFLEKAKHFMGENSLIVATADHGETMDELISENYGFDHGEFLYDHQLQVPLIIVPPNNMRTGIRVSNAVSLIDIMPTVLDIVGLSSTYRTHGYSLTPLLQGKKEAFSDRAIFLERKIYRIPPPEMPLLSVPQVGIRDSQTKLLLYPSTQEYSCYKNGSEVLPLDPKNCDPKMLKELKEWFRRTDSVAPETKDVSEEDKEKLRALGYVN